MFETEVENVKNYYADLLIIQYRQKPKARATIKLGTGLYLCDGLLFQMNNILDIDTAIGVQLDLIGKILGQPRNISGLTIDKDFFSFEKENAYGFSDKSALSQGLWKSYNNSIGSIYMLFDSDYRSLLKFKALYNLRRGSWAELDDIYYRTFGNDLKLINNKDLTVTYQASMNLSLALRAAILLGYIMPPLGIGYTIKYI